MTAERPRVVAGLDVMESALRTLRFAPLDAGTWQPIRLEVLNVIKLAHQHTLALADPEKGLLEMGESLQALEEAIDKLVIITPRG